MASVATGHNVGCESADGSYSHARSMVSLPPVAGHVSRLEINHSHHKLCRRESSSGTVSTGASHSPMSCYGKVDSHHAYNEPYSLTRSSHSIVPIGTPVTTVTVRAAKYTFAALHPGWHSTAASTIYHFTSHPVLCYRSAASYVGPG